MSDKAKISKYLVPYSSFYCEKPSSLYPEPRFIRPNPSGLSMPAKAESTVLKEITKEAKKKWQHQQVVEQQQQFKSCRTSHQLKRVFWKS